MSDFWIKILLSAGVVVFLTWLNNRMGWKTSLWKSINKLAPVRWNLLLFVLLMFLCIMMGDYSADLLNGIIDGRLVEAAWLGFAISLSPFEGRSAPTKK